MIFSERSISYQKPSRLCLYEDGQSYIINKEILLKLIMSSMVKPWESYINANELEALTKDASYSIEEYSFFSDDETKLSFILNLKEYST